MAMIVCTDIYSPHIVYRNDFVDLLSFSLVTKLSWSCILFSQQMLAPKHEVERGKHYDLTAEYQYANTAYLRPFGLFVYKSYIWKHT